MSTDLKDDLLVVGAPNQHSVHIFQFQEGVWQDAGTVTDTSPGFGMTVATNAETVVVGAPDAGTVSVYQEVGDGWQEVQKLTGDKSFGDALDIHGATLVVGAPSSDTVQVFEDGPSGWDLQATLATSGTTCLGVSVDVDESRLAASAVCDADDVFVFRKEGSAWQQEARLDGSTRFFGTSVALDSEAGLIASGDSGVSTVAVYEDSPAGWTHKADLAPLRIPPEASGFGRSVEIEGSTIAVGAFGEQLVQVLGDVAVPCHSEAFGLVQTCSRPGAVHLFERVAETDTWVESQRLTPPDGQDDSGFGLSVALDGETLAVGSPFRDLGAWASVVEFGTGEPLRYGTVDVFRTPGSIVEEVTQR